MRCAVVQLSFGQLIPVRYRLILNMRDVVSLRAQADFCLQIAALMDNPKTAARFRLDADRYHAEIVRLESDPLLSSQQDLNARRIMGRCE